MAAGDVTHHAAFNALAGDDADTIRRIGASAGGYLFTGPHFSITSQQDATLNDSDKTLTVPADRIWVIRSAFAQLITTATVGNRRLSLRWRDATDSIYGMITAAITHAASSTRHYNWIPGGHAFTTLQGDFLSLTFPVELVLPAAFDIRIFDINAIDAAADDMTVSLLYDEYTV